ncbi:hypothetical protein BLNAU_7876 [Blattamonas nauphoetae]|uniref:HDOD domain-containing protein n=1 Tax=Blattamonas nauphoetae TaxID=2049346 RepID=A0ABQ9XZX9_9EUKA|nr:hypothetical protein BLNAU_7876 [Blattamonas nauphoetae]
MMNNLKSTINLKVNTKSAYATTNYNNDQLAQIIADLQGEDLNKSSQALETLCKTNCETYQSFVALNGIDNQVLTALINLTTLNDTSPDTILLGGISNSTIWILANLSIHSEDTRAHICSHPSLLDLIAQFLVVDNYAFCCGFFFDAIVRKKVPDPQIFNSLYLKSLESIAQLANGDVFRSTRSLTKTHVHPLGDLFDTLRKIDIPYSALVNLAESNFSAFAAIF